MLLRNHAFPLRMLKRNVTSPRVTRIERTIRIMIIQVIPVGDLENVSDTNIDTGIEGIYIYI